MPEIKPRQWLKKGRLKELNSLKNHVVITDNAGTEILRRIFKSSEHKTQILSDSGFVKDGNDWKHPLGNTYQIILAKNVISQAEPPMPYHRI